MTGKSDSSWVVVTGGGGGIGALLVARLVARGHSVIATARVRDTLVSPKGGGRWRAVTLDFERPESVAAACSDIAAIVGGERLGGLVNMAGVIVEGPLEAVPPAALRRQLEINLVGPFALTQGLLPRLEAGGGRVVNVGAVSAHLCPPFYGPIAASKAGLSALNEAMRLEFAPLGVRVLLVEPGGMRTGIFRTARRTREAFLEDRPDLETRYRPALQAMEGAFHPSSLDDPATVVRAVERALFARKPKPEVLVGKGTQTMRLLSGLPAPWRDALIRRALGLQDALRPAY